MSIARLALMTLLVVGTSTAAASTTCNFLPERDKPQWILYAPSSETNYYGVGAHEISDTQKALEGLKQAKVAAINELSSNIELQLKSSFSQQQDVTQGGDTEVVEKKIRSITDIVSNATLKDVKYDETWLDHNSCIIWVKASVNKSTIDALRNQEQQQQKVSELESLIRSANDSSRSDSARIEDIGTARLLLDEINFTALGANAHDRGFYLAKQEAVSKALGANIDMVNQVKQQLLDADKAIVSANNTSSYQEKNLYQREAIEILSEVLTAHPFGEAKYAWAEQASFGIGNIYKYANDSCKAIVYYERVVNGSASEEWANKAQSELSALQCSNEDRMRSAWLQSFSGRNVTLVCAYKLKATVSNWEYLCDKFQTRLQEYGAATEIPPLAPATLKKSFGDLSNGSAGEVSAGNDTIIAVADGEISTRDNKKNPFGKDYQFKGKVSVYMVRNGNVEYSDRFQGAGGWNPMSEAMAMEVLGVHVAKRWDKRYAEILSKQ